MRFISLFFTLIIVFTNCSHNQTDGKIFKRSIILKDYYIPSNYRYNKDINLYCDSKEIYILNTSPNKFQSFTIKVKIEKCLLAEISDEDLFMNYYINNSKKDIEKRCKNDQKIFDYYDKFIDLRPGEDKFLGFDNYLALDLKKFPDQYAIYFVKEEIYIGGALMLDP